MMKYQNTIGFRLITSVVATGALILLMLAMIVSFQMNRGLNEQSVELGRLSKELLLKQLYGDAHLARDQLDDLSYRVVRDTLATAQKATTMKAVFTGNDVAVSESLKSSLKTSDLDFILALNDRGQVIGTNTKANFFLLNEVLDESAFSYHIFPVIVDNDRAKPINHFGHYKLKDNFLRALGYQGDETLAFVSIQPVFDEFGETTGGIIGVRLIKMLEDSFSKFATLSKTDVFFTEGKTILSRTDLNQITNLRVKLSHLKPGEEAEIDLIKSDDQQHVGSCAKYQMIYNVCVALSEHEINKMQTQMTVIGQDQTSRIKLTMFTAAFLATILLAFVLYFVIVRTMKGLPQLSMAANDVASGNLNVPFEAKGYGEIKTLSVAFERMLINLRKSTNKVQQLAYYCSITGLANREKLQEEAKKLFTSESAAGLQVMMVIDLKRFKSINENYGMRAGDFVLKKMGERLTHVFEFFTSHKRVEKVTIARTGGDDFVVVFQTNARRDQLAKLADIVISALAKPLRIGSSNLLIDANVGIGCYKQDGNTFDELFAHVQLAIETIDKKAAATYAYFEESMAKAALERIEIESELREAIRNKNLRVYYQPKVDLDTGKIKGGEALVRWIHPVKGFISPAKFIPVAEEAGMIGDIGRFVLERSIEETKMLLSEGHDITVAVNVSALQLEDPSFADEVLNLVERLNFPTAALELEITESMAMSDPEGVKERISKLREKGIRFSMDDFGTGYSNLSQLASMPIDVLKLDRSLIMNVDKDKNKQSLARSILELARDFGFKTVVEGVENAGELDFCINHDASMVQGFVFSAAQPLEKYRPLLVGNEGAKGTTFSDKFKDAGGTRDEREQNLIQMAPKTASLKSIPSPKTSEAIVAETLSPAKV